MDLPSVRKVIHWIVCQKAFDTFIMIVILLSRCSSHLVHHHFYHHLHHHQLYTTFVDSFAIAAEDPVDENNPRCEFNANGDLEIQQLLAKKRCDRFFYSMELSPGISTWEKQITFSRSPSLPKFALRYIHLTAS